MTDGEKQLIEKTKEFFKAKDGLFGCPTYGCRFVSRAPEAVCKAHGETVR